MKGLAGLPSAQGWPSSNTASGSAESDHCPQRPSRSSCEPRTALSGEASSHPSRSAVGSCTAKTSVVRRGREKVAIAPVLSPGARQATETAGYLPQDLEDLVQRLVE